MTPSAPSVARRSLDALFRVHRAPGPLAAAELARLGYPHTDRQEFPLADWRIVLLAAAKDWFPERPRAEALRELGHLFVRGFAETTVGAVLAAAARMIGTERALARIPSYLKAGRSGGAQQIEVRSIGLCHWQLRWRDDAPFPEVVAGAVAEIVALTGSVAVVTVEELDERAFDLDVRWTPRHR